MPEPNSRKFALAVGGLERETFREVRFAGLPGISAKRPLSHGGLPVRRPGSRRAALPLRAGGEVPIPRRERRSHSRLRLVQNGGTVVG